MDSTHTGSVDTVLFDLGGVLIDWDPARAYAEAFPQELERVAQFLDGPLTDIGLESCRTPGTLAALRDPFVQRYPEFAAYVDFFVTDWPRFVQGPMSDSVTLFDALVDRGVPVFGLTNWPEATFPPEGDVFRFLDEMGGIVVSGAEGMRKPDRPIFELTIERFGLQPRRTLYVDDHPGNVETASSLGFVAHHFTDAASLARRFRELGFLDES